MDKKRLNVTANADAIILQSETKCYEGRFTHQGIVVTVKERKDNKVKELLKRLAPRMIFLFVCYSAILTIVLNILDIKYIPYADVPFVLLLLTTYFLIFSLCVYAIYLIVISRYSISRKNRITVGLKLEILLNELLTNDYVCSSKEFKEKLNHVLISNEDIKTSQKSKDYSSIFRGSISLLIVLLLSEELVVKMFSPNAEILDHFFFLLFYITIFFAMEVIFEAFSINSLMTKLELKCCTTQKLYLRYVNLATAIAQKYFETEYPENFLKIKI